MVMERWNCHWCNAIVYRRRQTKNVKVHYCSMECKAEFQKSKKPVTKEWLEDHYVNQLMDCVQIGKLVSRDPKSVWLWLKDFGIPTRPRGSEHAARHRFKTGQASPFLGRKHTPETRNRLSDIAKSDGRVPFDPKVGSYMKGRKGSQTTNWKGGITPLRQSFYATPEWKSVERKVKIRDRYSCHRCERSREDIPDVRFAVHHIVSFMFEPLRCEITNLVYLCRPCHLWVHSNENTENEYILDPPKKPTVELNKKERQRLLF